MHNPSRAARKSLQMPCPLFWSTSPIFQHQPTSLLSLSASSQHSPMPVQLSWLSKTLTSTYHSYYHILSVNAQTSKRDLCPKQRGTTLRVYEAEPSHGHTQLSMQGWASASLHSDKSWVRGCSVWLPCDGPDFWRLISNLIFQLSIYTETWLSSCFHYFCSSSILLEPHVGIMVHMLGWPRCVPQHLHKEAESVQIAGEQ